MQSPTLGESVVTAEVEAAWRESCLADVPDAVAGELLARSRLFHVAAGEPLHGADGPAGAALVVDGLLRLYRAGTDGRQVTVCYVTSGALVGLAAVLGEPLGASALEAQSLRDSVLLELCPETLRVAVRHEPAVSSALCRYLFHQLIKAQHSLSGDVLLPVRSRVACHLLNLAEREDRELVVRATPQHLAAAVGSVREVVSRVLRHMEQAGLVQRRAGQLVLVDSAGLHRVWAGESGL